jgi:branched-chain amino acid transport system ATP-binding protein
VSPTPTTADDALIEARQVSKRYGAFQALDGVSLAIGPGEIVSIVGPNGAGKTTLVNLLTGLSLPTSGEVFFKGANIAGADPVALARRGMARTFQLVQIFPELTVAETIAAAVVSQQGKQWRLLAAFSSDAALQARVEEVAGIFGLGHRLRSVARVLSQGEKKLLDVASAFALAPEVILLDEPTSGVSSADKHGLMKTLFAAAKAAGVKAIILVEHDMDLVASYSQRVVALTEGKVLADLPPDAFFSDPHIIEAVVGKRRGA